MQIKKKKKHKKIPNRTEVKEKGKEQLTWRKQSSNFIKYTWGGGKAMKCSAINHNRNNRNNNNNNIF